jgi:hypothetical protein
MSRAIYLFERFIALMSKRFLTALAVAAAIAGTGAAIALAASFGWWIGHLR